jgi:hypothetical protein
LASAAIGRPLETKEFFAQSVFVSLFGSHYLAANFVFLKVCLLPFIDFSNLMVCSCERLFLLDCGYPFLDRCLIGGLHLI